MLVGQNSLNNNNNNQDIWWRVWETVVVIMQWIWLCFRGLLSKLCPQANHCILILSDISTWLCPHYLEFWKSWPSLHKFHSTWNSMGQLYTGLWKQQHWNDFLCHPEQNQVCEERCWNYAFGILEWGDDSPKVLWSKVLWLSLELCPALRKEGSVLTMA